MKVSELIYQPGNSLVKQSRGVTDEGRTNGDGFGLSWYGKREKPYIYKSTQPVWNDTNLKCLGDYIESSCLLAHIRAATEGKVTQTNCHPFYYRQYSMVHNGEVRGFSEIKRELLSRLNQELFLALEGQTDSELLFYYIMQFVIEGESLDKAVVKAFSDIVKLQKGSSEDHYVRLNIAITDGENLVATRYSSKEKPNLSLYYTPISSDNSGCIIASEALTDCDKTWAELAKNHMLTVNQSSTEVSIKPMDLS